MDTRIIFKVNDMYKIIASFPEMDLHSRLKREGELRMRQCDFQIRESGISTEASDRKDRDTR